MKKFTGIVLAAVVITGILTGINFVSKDSASKNITPMQIRDDLIDKGSG